MKLPQIFMLIHLGFGLYQAAKNHKQVIVNKFETYIIGLVFGIILLIWGGFFTVISWPQVVMIILFLISFCLRINQENYFYEVENFYSLFSGACIFVTLLYFGGFWK